MGHYQDFYRRRGDAKCYVGRRKQPTISAAKNCACTDENFECDFNFVKTADGKCIQAGPIVVPVGACQRPDDTFKGSNGWRKIPGDTCEGGLDKAKLMDLKCSENGGPGSPSPSPGKVTARSTNFEGFIAKTHYIPNTTVVLIKDTLGSLWRSADEGATWKKVEYGGEHNFQVVRLHDHVSGRVGEESQMENSEHGGLTLYS